MTRLRAMIRDHARLTLLLALALAVKAVVPTGFMLSAGGGRFLTVTICSDASGTPKQMQIAIPGKQDTGGDRLRPGRSDDEPDVRASGRSVQGSCRRMRA